MSRNLPNVMTDAEWEAFISQFNTKAPTGLRNAALFTIMHDAGLRTCEIIGLKHSDIKQDTVDGLEVTLLELRATKQRHKAKTPGNQQASHIVYLTAGAQMLLQNWRARKTALGLGHSKHVFTTLKGGKLDGGYIREVCARKGQAAGIVWRIHPHALRHTFATDLLEETSDLALVQEALGHKRPETTRIYAKVRNARLARAMTRGGAQIAPRHPDEIAELQALKAQVEQLMARLEAALSS